MSVYLDHNAQAPIRPEARAALEAVLAVTGNPSSVHSAGRHARSLVEESRSVVASLVGAAPREVVFTSGGTEANNMALAAVAVDDRVFDRLLVSAIEHPSVLEAAKARSLPVETVPVDGNGRLDLAAFEAAIHRGGTPLVSIMLANNETGVIQPVAEAAAMTRAAGGALHCDAVQGPGKTAVDLDRIGADLLTLSAHKIGGPAGVGALVIKDRVTLGGRMVGGGQERSHRAGTENLVGIVGFGAAARAVQAEAPIGPTLRDRLEERLASRIPDLRVLGREVGRLPNTSCIATPGTNSETLLIALDLEDIGVSAGSACSSGKVERSHVLAAMGIDHTVADAALRVSTGPTTTAGEVDLFVEVYTRAVTRATEGRKTGRTTSRVDVPVLEAREF